MTALSLRQQLMSLTLSVLVTTGVLGGVDQLATHYGEAAQPAGWAAAPALQTTRQPVSPPAPAPVVRPAA